MCLLRGTRSILNTTQVVFVSLFVPFTKVKLQRDILQCNYQVMTHATDTSTLYSPPYFYIRIRKIGKKNHKQTNLTELKASYMFSQHKSRTTLVFNWTPHHGNNRQWRYSSTHYKHRRSKALVQAVVKNAFKVLVEMRSVRFRAANERNFIRSHKTATSYKCHYTLMRQPQKQV